MRAPLYGNGICTRVDCVSLGIVVNRDAERFYDEGSWPKRYAPFGGGWWLNSGTNCGYSIIDSKAIGHFYAAGFHGAQANTVGNWPASWGWTRKNLPIPSRSITRACQPGHLIIPCLMTALPKPDAGENPLGAPLTRRPTGYALRPGITFYLRA